MQETFLPDYVCYNKSLCEDQLLLPLIQYASIDLFNDNSTCVATNTLQIRHDFDTWFGIIHRMYLLFSKCSIPHQPSSIANLSNLYSCVNSSKIISRHRLKDMNEDCLYGDDESYEESCLLNDTQHRFKCTDQKKNIVCLSHLLVGDNYNDCLDKSDEKHLNAQQSSKTRISFETMCDGFTELLPILIDEKNETDETECSHFPCNNTYTRCDGTWNCLDGADEVNCEWPPLCPSFHHMCLSKLTGNLTCLSIEHANNGNIDCFGSSDERQFCRENEPNTNLVYLCESTNQCISASVVCDDLFPCLSSNGIPQFCNMLRSPQLLCPFIANPNHVEQMLCLLSDLRKQTIQHLSLTVNSSAKWVLERSKLQMFPIFHNISDIDIQVSQCRISVMVTLTNLKHVLLSALKF